MNKQKLLDTLSWYINEENEISAILFVLLEKDDQYELKKVDLENNLQNKITEQFQEYITEKFLDNEELSYLGLSEHDDRKNVAYRYDFEQSIEELNFLNDVVNEQTGQIPTFNLNQDSLDDIFGYVSVVGNEERRLVTFKKHHPIDLVKRDRRLYVFPAQERFVEMQNDGFILNKGFDLMKVDNDLVVLNLKTLERFFSFNQIIEQESGALLDRIEASAFIDNMAELKEYTEGNKAYQRKLIRARKSVVLDLEFNVVSGFVNDHPKLKGILKLNETETAFHLKSANSKKIFIRLLNDDYLNSDLTEVNYSTNSKDKIE